MYFIGFLCTFLAWLLALAWLPVGIVGIVVMVGVGRPDAGMIALLAIWPALTFGLSRLGRRLRQVSSRAGAAQHP